MRIMAIVALMASVLHGADKSPVVVGYYSGWTQEYAVSDIPAGKLTHVNYAFAVIKDNRISVNERAVEHFRQFQALKQKHPHLKVLISVGGWTDSGPFSDMAMTAETRKTFVESCADFAERHALDGIDIDWEYPGGGGHEKNKARPEDTRNFTLLLQELRAALDAKGQATGRRYLLTIASPAGPQYKRMELDQIHKSLDLINVMTYDFAGEWSERTTFNAPLFPRDGAGESDDASIQAYLKAGVPAAKLVLGVPFYARAWSGVKNVNNGLDQPHDRKPPKAQGTGGWSYRNVATHYVGKPNVKRFWHEQAKVPWLFDEQAGLMVTYDDPESIKLKAQYAREKGLAGVMIWELSHDDPKSSLLNALQPTSMP